MASAACLLLSTMAVPAWSTPVPIGRLSTETPAHQRWEVTPLAPVLRDVAAGPQGQLKLARSVAWLASGRAVYALLLFEGSDDAPAEPLQWNPSCEEHKTSGGMFVRNQWRKLPNESRDDCLIAIGPLELTGVLRQVDKDVANLVWQRGLRLDGPGYAIKTSVAQNGVYLNAWLFARESFVGVNYPLEVPLGAAKLPPPVVQWGVEMSNAVHAGTRSPSGAFVLPRIDFVDDGRPVVPPNPPRATPATGAASAAAAAGSPAPSDLCPNLERVMKSLAYPREAIVAGLRSGTAQVDFTLAADGEMSEISVTASHPVFAAAAEAVVKRYRCHGIGRPLRVRQPFSYRLE